MFFIIKIKSFCFSLSMADKHNNLLSESSVLWARSLINIISFSTLFCIWIYSVNKGTLTYEKNNYKEEELANIIYKYGEEKFSKRIAKNICEARKIKPIEKTQELVKIVQMKLLMVMYL